MSFSLPKIPYLKPIDRLFILAYACVGLGVLLSVGQGVLWRRHSRRVLSLDWFGTLGIPVLFLVCLYGFVIR